MSITLNQPPRKRRVLESAAFALTVLLGVCQASAQVTRLDDPSQLGEGTRFVSFGQPLNGLAPVGTEGDAVGRLFDRWGIHFRGSPGNRLQLGVFEFPPPGPGPLIPVQELRHVPDSAETDGPLLIEFGRRTFRAGLELDSESTAVLSAFTPDGQLLGSVPTIAANPRDTFLGVETTDPRGIGSLVLSATGPDPVERVLALGVEYAQAAPDFTVFLPLLGLGSIGDIKLDTQITLVNLANTESDVSVFLARKDGIALGVPFAENGAFSTQLRPFESITFLLSAGTSLESPLQVGFAVVSSSKPLEATAIFQTYGRQGSLLGEASIGSASLQFLASGHVEKSTASGLNTGLAVSNPNPYPADISFTVFNAETRLGFSITLASGRQVSLFLDELFRELKGQDFSGTLTVRSNQRLAVTELRTRNGIATASLPLGGVLLPQIR